MWQLENDTPYQAERAFLRDRDGAEVWIVVVRATYTVTPDGEVDLAAEQMPVALAPQYLGSPGSSTLRFDTDLVLAKPTTDIIAVATAYAPHGEPTTHVDVGLTVGPVSKNLHVFGDRRWIRGNDGLELTQPAPFTSMPIVYERAHGGAAERSEDEPEKPFLDPRNPIGRGFALDDETLVDTPGPNVVGLVDEKAPAGFGAIPRDWEPRLTYAGTYEEKWLEERMPRLPEDFDGRFFQSAPADQQPERYLVGGERVELTNLTPSGRLQFALPEIEVEFLTTLGTELVPHRGVLHTLLLEPDESRFQLVWHGRLDCHHRIHELTKTVAIAVDPEEDATMEYQATRGPRW